MKEIWICNWEAMDSTVRKYKGGCFITANRK